MTYNEWEDREMYAPPMFAMVDSGETPDERFAWVLDAIAGRRLGKEIAKTLEAFPLSARAHAGNGRANARWAIQSTLYRLHGITTRETDAALSLIDRDTRERAFATATAKMEAWSSEHSSD